MKVRIEIRTSDVKQTFEALTGSSKKPQLGQSYSIGEDVKLAYMSGYDDEFSDSEVLLFLAGSLHAMGINHLSTYIYNKLNPNKATRILINGSDIPIDPKLIEEFIVFLKSKEEEKNQTDGIS